MRRNRDLNVWLGKMAADAFKRKTTGRSRLVKVNTGNVAAALNDGPTPAAHQAPTRYGRKPYTSGMERDSS